MAAMNRLMDGKGTPDAPFAPPFSRRQAGDWQTAKYFALSWRAARLGAEGGSGRLWVHQLQLTIGRFVLRFRTPTIRSALHFIRGSGCGGQEALDGFRQQRARNYSAISKHCCATAAAISPAGLTYADLFVVSDCRRFAVRPSKQSRTRA